MPRLPKGKKLLQAYVDEELLKEFKELAFCKHRRLRGALSWEVEEALKNWLALHDITKIEKINPDSKVLRVYKQVKDYIRRKYYYGTLMPNAQVPRKFIVEAIMALRGTTEVTVKRWFENFLRFKLIKHLGGELFELT